MLSQRAGNVWQPPDINANSRNAQGRLIQQGNSLVNFKYKNMPEYESAQGRFWSEAALSEGKGLIQAKKGFLNSVLGTKKLFVEGREVNAKSVRRYTAKLRGVGMIGKKAEGPRWHLDRVRFKPQIDQAIQDGFKLDLTVYQERLSDPDSTVQEEAIKELKVLKEFLTDAKSMREADLQKKYNRSVWIGRIATAIGFGAAAGSAAFNLDLFADLQKSVLEHGGDVAVKAFEKSLETSEVAEAISHGAEQLNKALTAGELTHQVTSRLGKKLGTSTIASVSASVKEKLSISSLFTKKSVVSSTETPHTPYRFTPKSAINIAIPLTLLVLTSLSGPGVVVTAIAITTTLTKIAANVKKEQYKNQLEQVELNGSGLLRTIEKMIEHHGLLWKKEVSELFQEEASVKDRLNAVLNQGFMKTPQNVLAELPEENQPSAVALLDAMMTNAANVSYNSRFEAELQKSVKLEGMNLNTVQTLRTRRQKLKNLYAASRAAAPAPASRQGLFKPIEPNLNHENEPNLPSRSSSPIEFANNNIRAPSPVAFSMRKTRKQNRNRNGRR